MHLDRRFSVQSNGSGSVSLWSILLRLQRWLQFEACGSCWTEGFHHQNACEPQMIFAESHSQCDARSRGMGHTRELQAPLESPNSRRSASAIGTICPTNGHLQDAQWSVPSFLHRCQGPQHRMPRERRTELRSRLAWLNKLYVKE